jgi:hypothetical protein
MIKKVLYLFITLLFLPQISFAEVDRFVFTTEPQTIKPNELSGPITIQAQNNASSQENVVETIDMVFTSSSNTGEFLNSSGGVVSKTMSKNTANRTFYYKDSKEGEFLITVTLTGRDSQKSFSASQKIKVSSTGQTENNNQISGSNTSTNTTSSTNTEDKSSHSSPAPTTGSKDILDFEISAGRDRFSSVGSEIIFQATALKLNGLSSSNINYIWNLGDGTKKEGNIISHKYRFAGEYNVVLNGSFSDKSAVSRIKVLVIDPILDLEITSNGVAVLNKSDGEVNLGEFILESGVYRFVFPKDTIIGKNKKIILSKELFNVFENKVILKNPLLNEIARIDKNILKTENIAIIDISTTTTKLPENTKVLEIPKITKQISVNKTEIKKEENSEEYKNSSSTEVIYLAKKDEGKIYRFFSWIRGVFR